MDAKGIDGFLFFPVPPLVFIVLTQKLTETQKLLQSLLYTLIAPLQPVRQVLNLGPRFQLQEAKN